MTTATSNRLLGLILIVALLVAGGRTLWIWLDKPIEHVSIRGDLEYVNAAYLQDQLSPLIAGQSWLSVDIGQLRNAALEVPWLKDVRLSRRWPDALTFELYEQRPVAWWNDDSLLNAQGEPFAAGPISNVGEKPWLAGPGGSGAEVLAYYDALKTQFARLDMTITQLRLEPRGAWRVQLDNAFWIMLGRTDLDMRLERFITAWQRGLSASRDDIRYIDLRYPNGVSVAWHGENEPENDNSDG